MSGLREALATRVVVADGAMGTMLRAQEPTLDDFQQLEGCAEPEDRAKIAELLRPERIGVHLSEEFQLHPEQSTDAIVVHHPEAGSFTAGGRP
ncbi:hypothetical protein ACWDFL_08165 [Streptomyces bungoensis]